MSTVRQKIKISSVEEVIFDEDNLANECRIRDYYAVNLGIFRPEQKLARCEQRYSNSSLRADMRTVNPQNTILEWEFKINADYKALGQILQYVALARENEKSRVIRGVIAAFTFTPELRLANERMNLNLELVLLPTWLRGAGAPPLNSAPFLGTRIPNLNQD